MRSTNRLFAFILLLAFACAAFAQQSRQNTPSVERLREHVTYLASDKLEGRRTGTSGANLAAEYIAREFARYGLRRSKGSDLPGMSRLEADSPRRYMQAFPYVSGVDLGKNNLLSIQPVGGHASNDLRVGQDWMPLGFSSNQRIENAAIFFVGYGITAAELNHNDYEPFAKGQIAIVFSGSPDGDNPHGQFTRYEDARWKAIAAANAGARALIIIAHEENLKEDRLARLRYDNSGGAASLPVIVISRTVAAPLLALNSSSELATLENEVARFAKEKIAPQPVTESVKDNFLITRTRKATVTLTTDLVRREVSAHNVIGILDGSDPILKNETIVIGAHYDHLGRGGASSLAPREGEIHHGADDNASGTAGVLELARLLTDGRPRPRRTVVFMAFSGEEEGLLGSNYYVNHPLMPLANTVAMMNMDMIGRMKDNKLIIGGAGTAQEWRDAIAAANASDRIIVKATPETSGEISRTSTSMTGRGVPMITGINGRPIVSSGFEKSFDLTINEDGFGPSDHSSFYAKQIPVLFFWTGTHADYHKPSDTADKINYDDEVRILTLVARLIHDIDANDKRPVYTVARTAPAGRSTGFRISLGTIPNYSDSNDGLLLDGVRDGSPAAKAGLKAGDKVVKLAGRDVRNVQDYTYTMGEMKAGQEYEVEVMRGGERLKLKITPEARK